MLARLKRFFGRLQARSLQRSDYGAESKKQPVENTDALAASGMRDADPSGGMANTFPPNYMPPADEGRPRH